MTYLAYYDRYKNTVDGLFTLHEVVNGKAVPIFEKLPSRSGQAGYTETSWTRGKSPIPFGTHRLWLASIKQGKKADYDGIGEFFNISSGAHRNLILGAGSNMLRQDIGLHRENRFKGSAGCIVLLDDTPARDEKVTALFKFLNDIPDSFGYIPLKVL